MPLQLLKLVSLVVFSFVSLNLYYSFVDSGYYTSDIVMFL